MATQRVLAQIPAYQQTLRTFVDTMWLYPPAIVERALATTTIPYTFDGTHIICNNLTDLTDLYSYIFSLTIQPGLLPQGYNIGVGTILANFGKQLIFQAPNGNTVIRWTLVKQLIPQSDLPLANQGDSPVDTVGYITTYNIIGSSAVFEGAYVLLDS
jgi:hypothetical protein